MKVLRLIFSLGIVKGFLGGLAGVAAGVGVTMLVRRAAGLPSWHAGPVLSIGILTGVVTYLAVLGVLNYWLRWAIGAPQKEEPQPSGYSWRRYFNVDLNHKVIGIQYLVTSLVFLPFAIILQILGRMHMVQVGPALLNTNTYESVISDHGIVMLFIVVLPAFSGIMNYLVPLLIGARDVAFPRLNAFTYWLVPPAGLLTVFALAAGGFNTGWTTYPPLSAQSLEPMGMNMVFLSVYISGLSSILTAVNFLTTIFKMRAPGMSFFRMPVLVWSALATVGLSLAFTQFIAMSFLMVLLERLLGMGFFNPQMGGQVLLYQFMFWFYSHPAVYIFVLLGLGIISDIVPVFARKPLFGYKAVAISSPGIAFGGTIVFAHHMFAAGMPSYLRIPFMITTLLVAVPTGVKVFAWTATMWLGKIRVATPLLFVFSAIITFLVGGLMGIPLGIVPVDLYLHDTYFVVAHFHAMLFGGFLFPTMAAIYYWFPKASGRLMSEKLGRLQWALMTVGAALLILPMFGIGLKGMRRRVASYPPDLELGPLHMLTLVGGVLIFLGVVALVYNLVRSARLGAPASSNPWNSKTLEWQTSSPPPEENFEEIPQVVGTPYGYGIPGEVHAVMGTANAHQRG